MVCCYNKKTHCQSLSGWVGELFLRKERKGFLVPQEGVLLALRESGQGFCCFKLRDLPNGPSALTDEPSTLTVGKRDRMNECFVGFVWGDKKSPNHCGSLGKGLGRGAEKADD